MLKIRLKRVGRRNDPSYRVVVTEMSRGPKSGNPVELVGFYNPKTKERTLDGKRIAYWMEHGAQPSGTVYNMLVDEKILTGDKKNVLPKKSPVISQPTTNPSRQGEAEAGDQQPTMGTILEQGEAVESKAAKAAAPADEGAKTSTTPAEAASKEAPVSKEKASDSGAEQKEEQKEDSAPTASSSGENSQV